MLPMSQLRKNVREVEGVIRTLNIGAMDASSTLQYNLEDRQPNWVKYLPFDSVTIINDSGADIVFCINQDIDRATGVPAGSIKNISGYGIFSFTVTNDANAITSGQIRMDFERQGMVSDNFTKRISMNPLAKILLGV